MPFAPQRFRPHGTRRDVGRLPSSQRGYDSKWRRLADAFINEQFAQGIITCRMCGRQFGPRRRDIHVDHIVRHNGQSDPLFWDRSNLQLLCPPCHGKKTVAEGRGSQNP